MYGTNGYAFAPLLIGALLLWAYPLTGLGGQAIAERIGLICLVVGGLWMLYTLVMAGINRRRGGVFVDDGY